MINNALVPGRRLHCSDPWHLLHGRDARRRDSQGQDGQQMGGAEVTIRITLKINWLLKKKCIHKFLRPECIIAQQFPVKTTGAFNLQPGFLFCPSL